LWSEQFDNASWVKVNASVTANTTTSPDGNINADSLVENTATNLHIIYRTFTSVSSTTYTMSCYIKPDTRTRAYLRTDTSSGTTRTLFDLTGAGSVVTLNHTSASITAVGNGWYRATITFTEGTGAANRLIAIEGAIGTSISYTGNGLTAFYLYGAQLEAGAYPTSYIPTTSASVTRNADVISKTGISSLIGQTEGTIFVDFQYQKATSDANGRLLQLWATNDTQNSIVPLITQTNQFQLSVFKNGASQIPIVAGLATIIPFGRTKIAIRYNVGTYSVYKNGVLFASGTGHYPTTLTSLNLGSTSFADRNLSNPIYSACVFPTALSNDELVTLTTL
jgi:hypothetical protein